MALLSHDHALEVCRAIVAASPADETEVTLGQTEDCFARFADDGPTQSADREKYDVSIRVRLNGEDGIRQARASCGTLDESDWSAALQRATALAKVSPADPDGAPLGGPVDVRGTAVQRPTQDHSFREKAAWIAEALGACKAAELAPAGLARTTVMQRTLVNSSTREVQGARSLASFELTAGDPGGAGDPGVALDMHANVDQLDVSSVIQRAVDKGLRGREPETFPAGETTVVLEPLAVSSLMLFAAYQGFGAQEYHEGRSMLCDRIGENLFPDGLAIHDDADNTRCPGWAFDGEGNPRTRVALLNDGALRNPVTDGRWAAKLGLPDTGHARSQPSLEGPRADNLVVAGGLEDIGSLVSGVDDGLLITQLHYTNMIEPRDLGLTGMTRGGTFRIRGGRVVGAVRNLRFTDSLVRIMQGVSGIGREQQAVGALFDGEMLCPALRVEGFRFTSTTEF
jgi:PmbA protein